MTSKYCDMLIASVSDSQVVPGIMTSQLDDFHPQRQRDIAFDRTSCLPINLASKCIDACRDFLSDRPAVYPLVSDF